MVEEELLGESRPTSLERARGGSPGRRPRRSRARPPRLAPGAALGSARPPPAQAMPVKWTTPPRVLITPPSSAVTSPCHAAQPRPSPAARSIASRQPGGRDGVGVEEARAARRGGRARPRCSPPRSRGWRRSRSRSPPAPARGPRRRCRRWSRCRRRSARRRRASCATSAGSVRAHRLAAVVGDDDDRERAQPSRRLERLQHRRGVGERLGARRPGRRAACRPRPTCPRPCRPPLSRPLTFAMTITWSSSAPSTFSGVALNSSKLLAEPGKEVAEALGPEEGPAPWQRSSGPVISPAGATTRSPHRCRRGRTRPTPPGPRRRCPAPSVHSSFDARTLRPTARGDRRRTVSTSAAKPTAGFEPATPSLRMKCSTS